MPNPLSQYNTERLVSSERASRDANLFRGFRTVSIPASTTYEFVIDIPAGIDIFGFTRSTEVVEGEVEGTFLTCTGFTDSGDAAAVGLNFDRRAGRRDNALSSVLRVTALTGIITHSPAALIVAPSTGPTTGVSVQTVAGAQPAFDSSEIPAFRYENLNATNAVIIKLSLFWQELANGS